jgi:hypothetical protein
MSFSSDFRRNFNRQSLDQHVPQASIVAVNPECLCTTQHPLKSNSTAIVQQLAIKVFTSNTFVGSDFILERYLSSLRNFEKRATRVGTAGLLNYRRFQNSNVSRDKRRVDADK